MRTTHVDGRVTPGSGHGAEAMRDEAELIRAARSGDADAFRRLVELKRARVVRIARGITGNLEDARDVAQTVFLTIWRSLDRYDPERAFDTWLYRVTTNAAIDHLRRAGPRFATLVPLPDETARGMPRREPVGPDAIDRAELQKVFESLAVRLAPQQRATFVLREIEGRTTAEVAEILNVRESTVRNHLHQARRVMRRGLEREFPALLAALLGRGPARPGGES